MAKVEEIKWLALFMQQPKGVRKMQRIKSENLQIIWGAGWVNYPEHIIMNDDQVLFDDEIISKDKVISIRDIRTLEEWEV